MISHIFLDLGHVAITADDGSNACNALLELIGENYSAIDTQELIHTIYKSSIHWDYCRGMVQTDDYYHSILETLATMYSREIKLSPSEVKDAISNSITGTNPEIISLARKLRENGYIIVIVTDTHPWQSDYFRALLDIDKLADIVIESHKFGKIKADEDFFSSLCLELHITPEQVLLIDDNPINNQNAKNIGINTHVYKDFAQLIESLQTLRINHT